MIGLFLAAFAACAAPDGPDPEGKSYTVITQSAAAEMMTRDDGHVVVDVRTPQEYAAGHIPGAINVPNETIGAQLPPELPDVDQIILVYCRSGRRSKEAAAKLFALGYANVYEFGGIIDWKGEIEVKKPENRVEPTPMLVIEANGKKFYAVPEDNSSASAFIEKLSSEPISVKMQDYGDFEKVGDLPYALPTNDSRVTTSPGDVILYQGDKITVYYDVNTWNFTRLAHIGGATRESLLEAFGDGEVTISFYVEWSE